MLDARHPARNSGTSRRASSLVGRWSSDVPRVELGFAGNTGYSTAKTRAARRLSAKCIQPYGAGQQARTDAAWTPLG